MFVSDTLSWTHHYEVISSRALKILGLLHRTFSKDNSVQEKKLLYISVVRSQLQYCSPVWRPNLIRDIVQLEKIQRATKYILMDFNSDYKLRLISLNLLPIMYIFEINDLIFFVKLLLNKQSCDKFSIHNYVNFCSSSTRLGTFHKLTHTLSHYHSSSHFYFNRIPRLWNSLPHSVIDLDQSLYTIRQSIKKFMWSHFLNPITVVGTYL